MKKLFLFSVLIIMTLFSACSEKENRNPDNNIRAAKNPEFATFEIVSYDEKGLVVGNGYGVFLSETGLAAANYHVLEGAVSAKALYDGFVIDIDGFYYGDSENNVVLIKVDEKIKFPYLTIEKDFDEKAYRKIAENNDENNADNAKISGENHALDTENSGENNAVNANSGENNAGSADNINTANFAITNENGNLIGLNGCIKPVYVNSFEKNLESAATFHPIDELRYDERVKPQGKYPNFGYIPDFGAVMTKYAIDKGDLNISTYAYYYKQASYSEILKYCTILKEHDLELYGEYNEGFVYKHGIFYISVFGNNEKNRTEIVLSSDDKWVKANFTEKKSRKIPSLNAKKLSAEKYSSFGINRYGELHWQSDEMQAYLSDLDNAGFVRTSESPSALAFESGYEDKFVCIYARRDSTFIYVTDIAEEITRLINLDLSNSRMSNPNDLLSDTV
jgi:hypothetical protein